MAAIQHYDLGEYWIPQATFQVNAVNTDPTTLTVRQQDPAGVETVLANAVTVSGLTASSTPVAKTGTGVFKLNPGVLLTSSGYWFVRFEGGGAVVATEEHQAIADPSEFTSDAGIGSRALVSLPVVKDWLERKNIDTGDDLDLVRLVNDISDRMIDESGGREFKVIGTNPQVRSFDADNLALRGTIRVGDMASVPTQVRLLDRDGTVQETVVSGDIISLPRNRMPWDPIRRLKFTADVSQIRHDWVVEVTGSFGFPAVPGSVRQAVLDAVVSAYDRPVEHYRQELGVQTGGEGTNVVVFGSRPQLISLPPTSLAVARSYADLVVA